MYLAENYLERAEEKNADSYSSNYNNFFFSIFWGVQDLFESIQPVMKSIYSPGAKRTFAIWCWGYEQNRIEPSALVKFQIHNGSIYL